MSTITTAYGVELAKLESTVGCKDEALLESLEALVRSDPFDEPGKPTAKDGLHALINGPLLESYKGRALQLYALELCCEHFGERLDGQGHVAYLDDLGWQTQLLESGPPLGLPRADDFPDVAHLDTEDVQKEFARWMGVVTDCDDPGVEDAREELLGWLQQCVDSGLGLVTFQH